MAEPKARENSSKLQEKIDAIYRGRPMMHEI
jgi:hypothetical protein